MRADNLLGCATSPSCHGRIRGTHSRGLQTLAGDVTPDGVNQLWRADILHPASET